MSFGIEYFIKPNDPVNHLIEVDLIIWQPQSVQQLQMPSWIPGSYMIRDFSKHITSMHAYEINEKHHLISPIQLQSIDSNTWEIRTRKKPVLIRIKVYAFDASVRAAFLDWERCFYNHSSLCLQVFNQTQQPCLVHLIEPPHLSGCEVASSLTPLTLKKRGFGTYQAESYDELIDHPVSIGTFQKVTWRSFGIPHQMIFVGAVQNLDTERLEKDLHAITQAHIAFFEPSSHKSPFAKYLFHVCVSANAYGGLEHRSSTALICKRRDLPYANQHVDEPSYTDFLGLCSHEYFHAWNVKNIQPIAFQPYRLNERNHTSLLWLFEGFTSYYDDLQLVRSQVISLETYLERLSDTINRYLATTGRLKQSVAQSSFDAWTKYYLMDENTPNAVVSYYVKGSLIALALDLRIREFTAQTKSLDDVMRTLWQVHGSLDEAKQGIAENGFQDIIRLAIGADFLTTWNAFEKRYIQGTEDLPFTELFENHRYILEAQDLSKSALAEKRFGARTVLSDHLLKVTQVLEGGSAGRGGVAAGDLLLCMNRERITASNFHELLSHHSEEEITLHVFRQDLLYSLIIPKDHRMHTKWKIVPRV